MQSSNVYSLVVFFFFQAEDGIRDLVRSRGLGDVYKRQAIFNAGNVGIGDTTPDEKLDVIGNVLVDGILKILSLIHI